MPSASLGCRGCRGTGRTRRRQPRRTGASCERSNVAGELTAPQRPPALSEPNEEQSLNQAELLIEAATTGAGPRSLVLSRGLEKRVQFDLDATKLHEVTPYAEIYGTHPRRFNFDKMSHMIPRAAGKTQHRRDDYPGLSFEITDYMASDGRAKITNSKDLAWEWQEDLACDSLIFQKSDKHAVLGRETIENTSMAMMQATNVPDIDEETGWESWLESTLCCAQEDSFRDAFHFVEDNMD